MVVPIARPVKRSGSRFLQARQRVPADLQKIIGKTEFKRSLRATSMDDVKRLHVETLAEWGRIFASARAQLAGKLQAVPERQIAALAGEFYREQLMKEEAAITLSAEAWEETEGYLLDQMEIVGEEIHGQPPEYQFAPTSSDLLLSEELLTSEGIAADSDSILRMAEARHIAMIGAARTMIRRANGDWGRDKTAERFPQRAPKAPSPASVSCPFSTLLAGWAVDNGKSLDSKPLDKAVWARRRVLRVLEEFVGHTDASRVSKADAVALKAALQAKGLKPATVRNTLSELSAVYRWGTSHEKVLGNPFSGILPKPSRRTKTRRPFTYEEAVTILRAARLDKRAVVRWGPWLLAATGARLNEVMQASASDIVEISGVPMLRIHTDEDDARAGGEARRSTKNEASVRAVPLHSGLISEGFMEYVKRLDATGPLFPSAKPDKMFGRRGGTAGKVLGRWMRDGLGIKDLRISPSHSWRHWWLDRAKESRMDLEVRDAISGHSGNARNESASYGLGLKAMPAVLAEAMEKIVMPDLEAPLSPLTPVEKVGAR
jgi:integrase